MNIERKVREERRVIRRYMPAKGEDHNAINVSGVMEIVMKDGLKSSQFEHMFDTVEWCQRYPNPVGPRLHLLRQTRV